jgi:arginase family enzyme
MLRSHGSLRDEYANKFGVLTFDADFDSVVESVQGNRIDSWAMVRGISDYADGMRNKQWQVRVCARVRTSSPSAYRRTRHCKRLVWLGLSSSVSRHPNNSRLVVI